MELSQWGNNSKTKNARVVFLVYDTSSQCDACTCKVSCIPYGLGVMARARSETYGQTDGRTGRTGVTHNALSLFFEYAGDI